jgi:hypothetical protein
VLDWLRRNATPAYFAILVRLLNRDLQNEGPGFDDYSDAELALTPRLARTAVNANEDPRTALLDLDRTLANRTSLDPAGPRPPYQR